MAAPDVKSPTVLSSLNNNDVLNNVSPTGKRKARGPALISTEAATAPAVHLSDGEMQKLQRIKTLAVAFNMCPNPSTPHLHKIARRAFLPPSEVATWFAKRRMLESWCAVLLPLHRATLWLRLPVSPVRISG